MEFSIGTGDYPSIVDVSDRFSFKLGNSGVMVDYNVFTTDLSPSYSGGRALLGSILEPCADERYYQDSCIDKWIEMKGPKRIERVNRKTGIKYIYSEGGIPFPDPLDRPGRTMLTSEGSKNRSSHLVMDPESGRFRILTPVECERMNGFSDGWTEGMTERQRYFTMGNALVVGLIEIMGRAILDVEDGKPSSKTVSQSGIDDY